MSNESKRGRLWLCGRTGYVKRVYPFAPDALVNYPPWYFDDPVHFDRAPWHPIKANAAYHQLETTVDGETCLTYAIAGSPNEAIKAARAAWGKEFVWTGRWHPYPANMSQWTGWRVDDRQLEIF